MAKKDVIEEIVEEVVEEVVEETTEIVEEVKEQKETKTKKPKTYIVKTKVKNFNGIVAGIHFAYGKSAVELQDGWLLKWFREKDYIVEEVK